MKVEDEIRYVGVVEHQEKTGYKTGEFEWYCPNCGAIFRKTMFFGWFYFVRAIREHKLECVNEEVDPNA